MLSLVFATALAAAPAPTSMPCNPDCTPQAAMAAGCPMTAQTGAAPIHRAPRDTASH